MAYQLTLNFKLTSGIVSSTDPLTDTPSVEMLLTTKGKVISIGIFTFGEVRNLLGRYNASYLQLASMAQNPPVNLDSSYPMITDTSIDNEEFVQWAQGFPDSPFTPYLAGLFP